MSRLSSHLKLALMVGILSATVLSCTKDSTPPVLKNFVSKEVALQLSKEYMSGLVDLAAQTNPEVSAVKPFITSDVTVYKVVYKTVVDNQEIEASGLVCVPATDGSYPVLSFQNGTNTQNAFAPSMFPNDFSYQLIEMMASMGYIVVIADYPGFGASSTIPHPYLIKEPTVQSVVDLFYATRELIPGIGGIKLLNEYYLLGYSQGGWATLALHKALEQVYSTDFNLKGSACGAGPYDLYLLMQGMLNVTNYPEPVYLGYIVNAYTAYDQITNPVTDIFNEPYASRISNLYTGLLGFSEINSQLTTVVQDLLTPAFLTGFETAPEYSSVRYALDHNSITGWQTSKPLLLLHGSDDKDVDPISTENMYSAMLAAGTSADICKKVIIPGVDHSGGIVPALLQGVIFLNDIKSAR
jgi:pimeloyl-ACP methyl ester carboxylesterase